MSSTTTATKTDRMVKAIVKGEGRQKTTYSFLPNPSGPGTGRAAAWMRKHHPLARVVSNYAAELIDGRTLELAGCTVDDLYTEPAAQANASLGGRKQLAFQDPEPAPLPSKSALRKMKPATLKILCERRALTVYSNMSKAKMIDLLCK